MNIYIFEWKNTEIKCKTLKLLKTQTVKFTKNATKNKNATEMPLEYVFSLWLFWMLTRLMGRTDVSRYDQVIPISFLANFP